MTIEKALAIAVQHHQAGELPQAEAMYRRILARVPNHGDALHLLGVLAGQTGRLDRSIKLIGRAIAQKPSVAQYHVNLGESHRRAGEARQAVACLRRAIELEPAQAEFHNNLGIALDEERKLDEAIAAYRAALALKPDYPQANYNLGVTLQKMGRDQDAISAYRRAIALQADYPEAHNNLGSVLKKIGRVDEAIDALKRAVQLRPDYADAQRNLGICLRETNRLDEAICAYAAVIRLKPDDADAHNDLGNALIYKCRFEEAIAACATAKRLRPGFMAAHNNLALALKENGQLDESQETCAQLIALDSGQADAHNNLGDVLKDKGQIERAIACYERAVALAPSDAAVHANLVYTLYFLEACPPAKLQEEHRRWARRHADQLRHLIRAHANDRNPDRPLRIGYVSPDFRAHPVGRFLLPLLANHDHREMEVHGYADVPFADGWTARLRACADVWRDIHQLSDEQAAEQIRQDRIDILVDLTMHMNGNRLLIFARKPAPVQVTYLAYCGTTGLETMDWRITDPYLDPPGGDEQYYTERSIRLPRTYWCYQPPVDLAESSAPPAVAAGRITFGCLNNFCKITSSTLQAWCQLLKRAPDSHLLLHAARGDHRQRMGQVLSENGIDPRRLGFVEKLPLPAYMQLYQKIDIALDPFPYVGGTTTCDALWMGVPVVTRRGETAISRGGVSILSNIGLPEFIAATTEQYVQIAADLAGDLPRLGELRSTLRQRMKQSPLMDAAGFAREMESAYRQMWRRWCGEP